MDNLLIEHLRFAGKSWEQVGATLGCTAEAARGSYKRHRLGNYGEKPAPALAVASPKSARDVCHVLTPTQPFSTPIPWGARTLPKDRVTRAVVYGDEHHPFHDEQALALVRAVIKDVQPDIIVHLGDGVDCHAISKYDTDPSRLWNLQDDIDSFRRSLHATADACPTARRLLLEGNHEDRLRRLIWGLPDKAKQLVRLREVEGALRWPVLLDLPGVGFEWVPVNKQPVGDVLPRMLATHGSRVSPHAGYSARLELEKYGHSGVSGHTHRMAVHPRRDYNGQSRWIEAGFVASYEQPYSNTCNWQQGMVVLEWSADFRLMQEYLLFFRDGRVLWKSQELDATGA